jgi:2'-5' RNA ligase
LPRQHPRSGHQRYFIAIIPPLSVHDEILSLKNYFKGKYNSKASLNSPPHITLHMPFLWREEHEDALIKPLKNFAFGARQFEIVLDGFGSFSPRVIFVAVKQNDLLSEFQRELQRFCKTELNLFNAQYKDLPFQPHVTIAFRDLKKEMFVLAWKEFKHKLFNATFAVERIILLKHDGKLWLPLECFPFK